MRDLNEAIRSALREKGALRGSEHSMTVLDAVDLSTAQKADPRFYPPGSVVMLNTGKAAQDGRPGTLVAVTAAGAVIELGGKIRAVRKEDLDRLGVYQPRTLSVAEGDRLQLKANGVSFDGRKLANGEIVTVAAIHSNGVIRLNDGRSLPVSFRRFTRGYAVTSYGSQGKTVDHVLFADSAVCAATNAEQWYVSISRGRKSVRIFTGDKVELASAIKRLGHRELAFDLFPSAKRDARSSGLLLRGLLRGREFAKRVCAMIGRRTSGATIRHRQGRTHRL